MITAVIERIHASPFKFNIITTGAGGSAIASLMAVPGCSRTLLNAQVPYSPKVTRRILDSFPEKHVCPEIGRQLAQHAFEDACRISDDGTPTNQLVGIGATAAIQTDRSRKSDDNVYVAAWSESWVKEYACSMSRDMTRAQQEAVVCSIILKAMAESANVLASEISLPDNVQQREFASLPNPIASVLSGVARCALYNQLGEVRMDLPPYTVEGYDKQNTIYLLYPGSFKPLHWGHTELARVAGIVMQRYQPEKTKVVVTYEISASIVGKKDVCEADFVERVNQFTSQGRRVAITTARLFVEKAEMFPNHGLIVGVDTARRVIDPQYYDNSEEKMIDAIKALEKFGCYFVVGGRKHGDLWDDLSSVNIPDPIKHMFKGINPTDFRVDISSTEIRARRMSTSE